jgi:4-hydroxyphenylpyruvate dioxygenase-like putative hemolysin
MNNLPLDHIAYRVIDRDAAVRDLEILGYTTVQPFKIPLKDGSVADSFALAHPTDVDVFVSSGPPGSLIAEWVKDHGGRGGVHHLGYATENVAKEMQRWVEKGFKFQTPEPLVCSCPQPITQIFTTENPTTGIIYELIDRNGHPGFCLENVKRLMDNSTNR